MEKMRTPHVVKFQRMAGVVMFLTMVLGASMTRGAVDDPTATLSGITGSVFGTTTQKGRFAAEIGTVLQSGDAIETLIQSSAALSLSEGSTITLGENTKMEIAQLVRDQVTTARKSRVKLLAGRMRAELSAGHQDNGAAFSIETPNTLASVKFSRPIIEAMYNPLTDTTTIDAYTMEVVVTNLRTMEVQTIPLGYRGIIHQEKITILELGSQLPGAVDDAAIPPEEGTDGKPDQSGPPSPSVGLDIRTLLSNRTGFREAASSAPSSVGTMGISAGDGGKGDGGGETSENPSVGSVLSADDERAFRQLSITLETP